MKKIVKLTALLIVVISLLTSCSGSSSKSKMCGTWYREGSNKMSFELYDDGTCKIANEYGTGTWEIVNDNQFKLTNYYGKSEVATIVEITDNKLVIGSGNKTQTFVKGNTAE